MWESSKLLLYTRISSKNTNANYLKKGRSTTFISALRRVGKFQLALVFKVMDEAVKIMDALGKMKHTLGPLWTVQLCLNAILANHITLKRSIPKDFELKIEGA